MFCQWCGTERDPDSNAIHHCGSKDRPAAFCMSCGTALADGDTACASCGTPAGQMPAPVLVAAVVQDEAIADMETSPLAPGSPGSPVGPRVASPPPRASTRPMMNYAPTEFSSAFLRKAQIVTALVGTLAFFIPWIGSNNVSGFSGISAVTQSGWTWWSPPAPQLLFGLLLFAFMLSLVGRNATSNAVSALVALIGLALVVFCSDYLYEFRSAFSLVTGFYVVVAACVLLFGFAVTSLRHDGR